MPKHYHLRLKSVHVEQSHVQSSSVVFVHRINCDHFVRCHNPVHLLLFVQTHWLERHRVHVLSLHWKHMHFQNGHCRQSFHGKVALFARPFRPLHEAMQNGSDERLPRTPLRFPLSHHRNEESYSQETISRYQSHQSRR